MQALVWSNVSVEFRTCQLFRTGRSGDCDLTLGLRATIQVQHQHQQHQQDCETERPYPIYNEWKDCNLHVLGYYSFQNLVEAFLCRLWLIFSSGFGTTHVDIKLPLTTTHHNSSMINHRSYQ